MENLPQKPKLFMIAGPTAVGKTSISVRLAKEFDAEIISADSMQIYRGMNVGTGKITEVEKNGIPHHLIDIIDVNESYSVGQFVEDAEKAIGQLQQRKKNILVAGGTGLYLNALIHGYNFADIGQSETIREHYLHLAETKGNLYLWQKLKQHDPESAEKISINDVKRLIRALEILEVTGEPKSKRATKLPESKYDILLIILNCDRMELYEKINCRVDDMLKNGLMEEARKFTEFRDAQSMQAIGYKEFVDYFDGKTNYTETIEAIKKHSRNYAKRQMTFFRWIKTKEKLLVDTSDYSAVCDAARRFWNTIK